jgi:tRNA threonylcarbamoyladenosine biosynthesis protein TsaB
LSRREFRCLAIDTSTDTPNVAACRGEHIAAANLGPGGQTEDLYRYVDEVLAGAGVDIGDLDCVAVGRGPGSFTGLRVGIAAAQALAFAACLPVCPVSSLAVLAWGAARQHRVGQVVALLDARMGEVYAGCFRIETAGADGLVPECVVKPEALRVPGDEPFLAAGPGWAAYPALAQRYAGRILGTDPDARPWARDLLLLARHAFAAGAALEPAAVSPSYLRDRVTG